MGEEINSSELGTYEYWNKVYSEEVDNYNDHGDVGEIWFGMDTSRRIISWLDKSPLVGKDDSVIDLGCGNGMLLIGLSKKGFTSLTGIDYCGKAIQLASSISKSENCNINFVTGSILDDSTPVAYKIVLDKGTYDAISLDPVDSTAKREIYRNNVHKMLEKDGIFLITSCNWTEDEIIRQFNEGFERLETIPAPSFSFGGKVGKTVSSIAFRKINKDL